ncbi:Gfo/Idh/MocA family oxidoreductase [Paenibacillus lycopersici]|uniref:Gfo/Idh/MocA family oxidoreductase n=1 Tax=Paenibacillus lycopersici TaxID=2704462 RepID=A0A6C0FSZ3_9BACL|nr:Gfo/Idh/MocA family oxidoreductase [Paenibacillus lycopersici]QHT60276.1 Gfo/Idh/MocA family oxidoreductase [Paenibacillus lycopersici]
MTLRMIQVGLGMHGFGVAKAFVAQSPDFKFAGVAEINPDRLNACAEELGVAAANRYTDYNEAFRSCEADAVFVTAASPYHYAICKAALEQGLHVLVEKPFVVDMAEACELVDLAERQGRVLMVSQNYRYINAVRSLKAAIAEAGKPMFADVQFCYDHFGKDYQQTMPNFMLLEMAVHHIDMVRFLFDANIRNVSGHTWNVEGSMYSGHPNVQARMELENGMPVFYLGSLVSKGLATPWEGEWRIQCEHGSVHLADLGQGYGVYVVDAEQNRRFVPYHEGPLPSGKESIHGVLAEFAASIAGGKAPSTSGRDNLQTLATLFAIGDSSSKGAVVAPASYIATR